MERHNPSKKRSETAGITKKVTSKEAEEAAKLALGRAAYRAGAKPNDLPSLYLEIAIAEMEDPENQFKSNGVC